MSVDLSAIEELRRELNQVRQITLGRLAERGYQLLREEVPKVTRNLMQGVAPPAIKGKTATLTVSARSARRGARMATLHLKSGKTKEVKLRANPAFNYAETVAKGRPAMRAREAKVLIIPVSSPPSGESYIEADGTFYVMRKSAKAVKPNPFDERAARRLEAEAVVISEAAMREVFDGR
jgi:hypothetical protein